MEDNPNPAAPPAKNTADDGFSPRGDLGGCRDLRALRILLNKRWKRGEASISKIDGLEGFGDRVPTSFICDASPALWRRAVVIEHLSKDECSTTPAPNSTGVKKLRTARIDAPERFHS
jgi:hypothetical protein